ncbi:MAG TPA: HAMP domain-containing sensor histidine kinase [Candidatus Omnitrophota bacterium]|nr:HAMP domain-containing sensor histidine kinase [Candidatus Omnitrophota bacterium]HPS20382.1 HAMP domain-containing sensor histidine kinase [Candidatus Omnitrophota bacterium]
MPNSKVKFPLALKFMVITATVLVLTISSLSLIIFLESREIMKKRIFSDLSSVAKSKSSQISELFDFNIETAGLIASRMFITEGLEKINSDPQSKEALGRLCETINIAQKSNILITRIDVMDMQNKLIYSSGDSSPAVQNIPASSRMKPCFGDIYLEKGKLLYDVYFPIISPDSKNRLGTLKVTFNSEQLINILSDHAGIGKTGEWLLGMRRGNDLIFINAEHRAARMPLEVVVPLDSDIGNPMEYATGGKTGITIDKDYSGTEVLAAYTCISTSNMGFEAKIDTAEAFKPIHILLLHVVLFGLIILALGVTAAAIAARHITAPLKILHKATEALAAGEQKITLVDIKRDDEVGLLATSFGQMVSKRVADELRKSNDNLKQLNEAKSLFVSMVSHEIKNPLSVIHNSVDLLLADNKRSGNTPRNEKLLGFIHNSTDRLIRLVTDLLDLSKIESGKIELKMTDIDLPVFIKETTSAYIVSFYDKNLNFTCNVPENIGPLRADKDKLCQILINIIGNAIKYTPSGGSISLTAIPSPDKIRFEITDTGPGIAKEHLKKIFEKFERVASSEYEGTGLGLAIAKSIVELHKGEIWAESELGKGSKFIFTMPRNI